MAEIHSDNQPKKNILVVTDTPEDLALLQSQLGDAGYELVQTWGVEQALKSIEAHRPDLVLLDVTSPGIQGLKLCGHLRQDPETEALPVIIIASPDAGWEQEAVDIGADGFICRPFERVELLSRVRTLLRMSELHRRVRQQNDELRDANIHMDRLIQELRTRNRELELGMEMAHRLQDAMLPQGYPRVENVHFAHKYTPAEAIGGDVFQIESIGDDRAAIFVADVSGHGVRAALVTSIVRTVVDYIDMSTKTPGEVLHDFNNRFRSVLGPLTPQIYVTAVVIFVDGANRTVHVANAGHPRPLLVSKRRNTAEPIMHPDDTGIAIGFISNPQYKTHTQKLDHEDTILAFTDGVFEVHDESEQMFGLKRLHEFVASNAHLIPRDLIQKIITETEEFMATSRRPDDLCMVTAEVL